MTMPKTNYHTHTTWCDGSMTPEEAVEAALSAGFGELGFSSHTMLPGRMLEWTLDAERGAAYAAQIRSLAAKHSGRIRILCGVEADWIPGSATPDRKTYAAMAPDYIIGSVHFAAAPDGAPVPVDESPQSLADGIERHFGGDAKEFVKAYFAQLRDMLLRFDFDIAGHLDLPRKFNAKHPYFDETAAWYREELEKTADAVAQSGKIVEVNTGGIARGWIDDAYPSPEFRRMLRGRGARFVLSSDAHCADALDFAFDRFQDAENYTRLP